VPVRQPYAGVDFIPQSGIYEFGYGDGYGYTYLDIQVPMIQASFDRSSGRPSAIVFSTGSYGFESRHLSKYKMGDISKGVDNTL
jgi:hypothetical protein